MARPTKTEERYEDRRYGFPVILEHVRMQKVRGDWVPDVNARELRDAVLRALIVKPAPLTGNEVRFIRQALDRTQVALAEELGVTHPAVSKWESTEDSGTGMQMSTEFLLRFGLLTSFPDEFEIALCHPDGSEAARATFNQGQLREILNDVRRRLRPQIDQPGPVRIDYADLRNAGVLRMST